MSVWKLTTDLAKRLRLPNWDRYPIFYYIPEAELRDLYPYFIWERNHEGVIVNGSDPHLIRLLFLEDE